MPGGAGGYNIPVSVSASETLSIPTSYNAPYQVNYGTGYFGGNSSAQANPVQPATATSSAAEGNAGSSTTAPTTATNSANGGGSNTLVLVSIGLGIIAIGLIGYVAFKHK